MKRLRLVALGTTVVLLAVLALMGGGYLHSAGTAHADAAVGRPSARSPSIRSPTPTSDTRRTCPRSSM